MRLPLERPIEEAIKRQLGDGLRAVPGTELSGDVFDVLVDGLRQEPEIAGDPDRGTVTALETHHAGTRRTELSPRATTSTMHFPKIVRRLTSY